MKRGIYLAVLGAVVLCAVIVTPGGAQVHPVRWYGDQSGSHSAAPPSLVLTDGNLQFPDGTVQVTAAGSGESLGVPPSPTLVLADGGIQFADGTVQATAAGSLVPRTGQTTCYDADGNAIDCATDIGPGQDGDLQRGAPWPNPRFTINESSPGVPDGTVTDNLTGLIWLQDASCATLAGTDGDGQGVWTTALSATAALADGTCGLTDSSLAGHWRLPHRFELESLLDLEFIDPALSNAAGTAKWTPDDPFSGVELFYWSSTTYANITTRAWYVIFNNGVVSYVSKDVMYYVWPVRGGQDAL